MSQEMGLTVGDVARRYGCGEHHVRRLFTRGILPEPPRFGPFRRIPVEQLGRVEAALRKAGYIAETQESEPPSSPDDATASGKKIKGRTIYLDDALFERIIVQAHPERPNHQRICVGHPGTRGPRPHERRVSRRKDPRGACPSPGVRPCGKPASGIGEASPVATRL